MQFFLTPSLAFLAFVLGFLAGRWDRRAFRRMHRAALIQDVDAVNAALIDNGVRLTPKLLRALDTMRADVLDLA